MYCSKCGKQNNDFDKFCGYCGEPMKPSKKICPNCKKEIEESIKFCPYCGSKVSAEISVENNSNLNVSNTAPIENNTISKGKNLSNIIKNKKMVIGACLVLIALLIGIVVLQNTNFSKSRTVMIYMVGSNLESDSGLATNDLSYLDYKKISEHKTKVVMIAGGTASWQNNYVDVNKTSIYELKENGFEEVDSREITNMGSSANLSYFLNYVYDNYKSKAYDFIYWNHGGAVDGSEYDTFYNDNLKLTDMKQGFLDSPFKGNNKLEVLSFRTCLNSTIELANIYKDHAEYLVASEEVTRGSNVASALEFLNIVMPTDDAVEYGRKEIKNYQDTINTSCYTHFGGPKEENYCFDSTYSIVDLSKIDPIISSLDTFSKEVKQELKQNYNILSKLRSNTSQYAGDDVYYDMVDLYDLSEQLSAYSKNESTKLQQAIKDAVVYNWSTNDYSHGLSIYFPYNGEVFLPKYDEITPSKNYYQLVTSFNSMKKQATSDTFSTFSSKKIDTKNHKKESADVEIQLTNEQVKNFAKARYFVFVDNKDGYYNMLYRGNTVKLEDNKLKANVKGILLKIADKDYLKDNEWIRGYEKEVTDDYTDIIGMFTVKNHVYDSRMIYAEIRIDKEHPNGYIKDIYFNDGEKDKSNSDFSAFSPVSTSLKNYNYIESFSSAYKILDENGNYNEKWSEASNGIIKGKYFNTDQFTLVKEDFSSDYNYYVIVQIWDTANNTYFSNVVKIGAE